VDFEVGLIELLTGLQSNHRGSPGFGGIRVKEPRKRAVLRRQPVKIHEANLIVTGRKTFKLKASLIVCTLRDAFSTRLPNGEEGYLVNEPSD
jgi:hypothetical protein